jgi:hypothetical protein
VLPAAVASIEIAGARALKVGDTLELRAEPRDQRGSLLTDREVSWASSQPEIASVDSASGVVVARGAGSADVTAASEGKSGKVRVTVLPQPRTSRAEVAMEAEAHRAADPPPADPAAERLRMLDQMRAGVDRCYGYLVNKDVERVEELYKPETKADREHLKRLSRILRTREWEAQIGARNDGAQRIEPGGASMEFNFKMTWKDAFGGRLSSQPVFRAEFTAGAGQLALTSCRIVGSPRL